MKNLFLLIINLLVIVCGLQAQDLIVTSEGDTINCKITKTTKDYVHFTFKYNNEIRNTLLPVDKITTQQKDYFSESEVPADYTYKEIFPHFRLAVDGGWQYRIAKMADGVDNDWLDHAKKMRSGFHYDIQAAYFFTKLMGIELMFSQQLFEHSVGDVYLTDDYGNLIASGNFNEKNAFNYIAANYLIRLFDSKKKNCWVFSYGLGYIGYKNRVFLDNVEYVKITAATLGITASVGYDLVFSKDLVLGFKVSMMDGSFRDYKQTLNGITTNETMPDETPEGLGTIRLSVGLRFNN
ncbi:hypothetical protein FACS1894201_05850 [Bacteroidia bacterium]|nr:hypothetical protein FACS1894201_05850 [Bacteroidia bacterium]